MIMNGIEIKQEDPDYVRDVTTYTIRLANGDPDALAYFEQILQAMLVFAERNGGQRRGVWRRSGVKGQLFHLLAKAERAFIAVQRNEQPDQDHLSDAINYAAFAGMLGDDLNGDWPWLT